MADASRALRRSPDNWKTHRAACTATKQSRPYIVHVDWDRETTDEAPWCKPFLDSISIPYSRTYVLVTDLEGLATVLGHPIRPSAILCSTNITEGKHAELRRYLRAYAENGGRLVIGGPVANYFRLDKVDGMFADLGVNWKMAGYHRTTHSLNVAHPLFANLPGTSVARAALPSTYSCKSVFLKDVPPLDALYRSTEDSGVESLAVALSGGSVKAGEVAVAMGKVGEGWLGYCGDVNQEAGSTQATLFMLGLKA
ncbi:hypothetical protein Rhopal_000871-T1 [Rhodotorula paludigena]|uniref:Uncharacterized protein n=1 Tax=Rhodotorula paludigena TaxID=86838 RepID=A0AAV5G5U6_9BASI|nr:hypothetical protein Rhopal_000871-T1 [Rhodotorula paludigena]